MIRCDEMKWDGCVYSCFWVWIRSFGMGLSGYERRLLDRRGIGDFLTPLLFSSLEPAHIEPTYNDIEIRIVIDSKTHYLVLNFSYVWNFVVR